MIVYSKCTFMILYIDKMTFFQCTLLEILERKNVSVEKCDFKLKEIKELNTFPRVFVIDAEMLNLMDDERIYLCDLCIKNNIQIIIMGEEFNISQVLPKISPHLVAAVYQRPFYTQEIAERMCSMLETLKYIVEKKKILVIDDSPMFLRIISGWLESDYTVSICPSATAAFRMISNSRPDMILLDYEMPVCSGAQFLEMLKNDDVSSKIPVFFLTSKDDMETVKLLLSLKPNGYMLKSLPKEKILNTLSKFFADKEKDSITIM